MSIEKKAHTNPQRSHTVRWNARGTVLARLHTLRRVLCGCFLSCWQEFPCFVWCGEPFLVTCTAPTIRLHASRCCCKWPGFGATSVMHERSCKQAQIASWSAAGHDPQFKVFFQGGQKSASFSRKSKWSKIYISRHHHHHRTVLHRSMMSLQSSSIASGYLNQEM